MMNITYTINGLGLGHAARSIPVIQALQANGHQLKIISHGLAKTFLKQNFADNLVNYSTQEPPFFANTMRGYCKNLYTKYLPYFSQHKRSLNELILQQSPDIIISDDDFLSSIIANKNGIPLINISFHNPIIEQSSLTGKRDRIQLKLLQTLIDFSSTQSDLSIHATPFKTLNSSHNIHRVDPILPSYITDSHWQPQGTHAVVYFNQALKIDYSAITRFTKDRGLSLSFYGNTPFNRKKNLCQNATSHREFITDLLTADALICTPGSQLLNEAAYIGLPTTIIKPQNQRAQQLTAKQFANYFNNISQISEKLLSTQALHNNMTPQTTDSNSLPPDGLRQTIKLIETALEEHPSKMKSEGGSLIA